MIVQRDDRSVVIKARSFVIVDWILRQVGEQRENTSSPLWYSSDDHRRTPHDTLGYPWTTRKAVRCGWYNYECAPISRRIDWDMPESRSCSHARVVARWWCERDASREGSIDDEQSFVSQFLHMRSRCLSTLCYWFTEIFVGRRRRILIEARNADPFMCE